MTTRESHLSTARRIDEYAHTFDVTDTLVITVDAEPEAVVEALERIDLTTSAARALHALGVGNHIAFAPSLLAAERGTELVFGLVWRVEGPTETVDLSSVQAYDVPGHVKVIWNVRVEAGGLDGACLSTTTRFAATDEATRERLLAGWGIIGTFATSLSRRTLAAVKAYAEELEEEGLPAGSTAAGFLPLAMQSKRRAA